MYNVAHLQKSAISLWEFGDENIAQGEELGDFRAQSNGNH